MHRLWRGRGGRLTLTGLGLVLVVVGALVIIFPVLGVLQRSGADQRALQHWHNPGAALSHQLPKDKVDPGTGGGTPAPLCASGSSDSEYALLAFPSLPGVEGVAASGGWGLLTERSVVHYGSSPAAGAQGNSIYAVHREPNFEPLGTLSVGDAITLTDRSCQKFTYQITQIWTESPSQVTQLQPLSTGSWVTVITCTPLWVDSERLVLRARLEGS